LGVWWEDSVYYLWFEYLRRNERYKTYCETKKGTKGIKKLYEDFGDIHSTDFKQWWRKTGSVLFCEQVDLERVEEITNTNDYQRYQANEVLMVAIPTHKELGWLKQQVDDKIRKHRTRTGTSKQQVGSTAIYPLHTTPDPQALKMALRVWDEYTAGNKERVAQGQRKRSQMEIANLLYKRKRHEAGDWEESAKQMVFRYNKTATHIIENVGKGIFPKHNARG